MVIYEYLYTVRYTISLIVILLVYSWYCRVETILSLSLRDIESHLP